MLFGGCLKPRPDCDVTFELGLRCPQRQRYVALDRVDWKPLKGEHTNPQRKDILYEPGKRLVGTHWHIFEYNVVTRPGGPRLLDDLPCAVPVFESTETFKALRSFVGRVFNIADMSLVSPPPWAYVLPL